MSHYYQPDNPIDVQDAAVVDWVRALSGFSQQAIERSCEGYLRDQPRRRPTPGDILSRTRSAPKAAAAMDTRRQRSDLSRDELELLDFTIIPAAKRWLANPGLSEHAKTTLDYWNEPY